MSEIANTETDGSNTTTYPGEGLFFLADEGGTYTGNATGNTFSGYSGYGITEDAGYDQGNCSTTCAGGIVSTLTRNTLALTGGQTADGISLEALGSGDNLSAHLTGNKGYVTSPSAGIETTSASGGTLDVIENNDNIVVHTSAQAVPPTAGTLHRPAAHR